MEKVKKLIQLAETTFTMSSSPSSTSPVVAPRDVSTPGSSHDVETIASEITAFSTSDAGSSKDMVVISDDSVMMSDNKKRKVDDNDDVNETDDGNWIRVQGMLLKNSDKSFLLMGNKLNNS